MLIQGSNIQDDIRKLSTPANLGENLLLTMATIRLQRPWPGNEDPESTDRREAVSCCSKAAQQIHE